MTPHQTERRRSLWSTTTDTHVKGPGGEGELKVEKNTLISIYTDCGKSRLCNKYRTGGWDAENMAIQLTFPKVQKTIVHTGLTRNVPWDLEFYRGDFICHLIFATRYGQ